MESRNVWDVISKEEVPKDRRCIKCKWIFKIKSNGVFRARLVVKSPSSSQKQKLDILHSPKKNNPTVIKCHEDTPSIKSNLSSKKLFWGSPDISSGIESLFDAMGLYEKSKSLIISMILCSVKNMIQRSELDLHEVVILFPRQDLRESVFQESVIKVLYLGRSFNDVKKVYVSKTNRYPLGVDEHQVSDHPRCFMNMINGRSQAISASNNERCQVQGSCPA
jgi:hypothetical protein